MAKQPNDSLGKVEESRQQQLSPTDPDEAMKAALRTEYEKGGADMLHELHLDDESKVWVIGKDYIPPTWVSQIEKYGKYAVIKICDGDSIEKVASDESEIYAQDVVDEENWYNEMYNELMAAFKRGALLGYSWCSHQLKETKKGDTK